MIKEINLTNGYITVIDDKDYDLISSYTWHSKLSHSGNVCAATNIRRDGKQRTVRMHRFIMNAEKGTIIDHLNNNSLDNRRENLKIVSNRDNAINNKKPYNDTYFDKRCNKWQVAIRVDKKLVWLGYHSTKEEAQAVAMNFRINNNLLKNSNNPIEKARLDGK